MGNLPPCRCGSTDLHVHVWRLGSGANVWCGVCNAGTPAGSLSDLSFLVVNVDVGFDARPLARERWSAWVAAGA